LQHFRSLQFQAANWKAKNRGNLNKLLTISLLFMPPRAISTPTGVPYVFPSYT
jgi:hypothetical protein